MMQGSSFANSLLTSGIIYVHSAGRTPIQLAPDSAHADLLKALYLEEGSSVPQCMSSHKKLLITVHPLS